MKSRKKPSRAGQQRNRQPASKTKSLRRVAKPDGLKTKSVPKKPAGPKARGSRTANVERLEELAHAMSLAPAMLCALDGEILLWGRGLETLYGRTAKEAVGKRAYALLATEHPVPRSEIQAELLATGEWQGELIRTHSDGHRM